LRQTCDRLNTGEVTRTDVAQAKSRLAAGCSQLSLAESNYVTAQAQYQQAGPKVLAIAAQSQSADRERNSSTNQGGCDVGFYKNRSNRQCWPPRERTGWHQQHANDRRTRAYVCIPCGHIGGPRLRQVVEISFGQARCDPLITTATYNVDIAVQQVKIAEGALYPTLSAVGNVQKTFGSASALAVIETLSASVGAQLSAPIYQGGSEYSTIRQARETLGQRRLGPRHRSRSGAVKTRIGIGSRPPRPRSTQLGAGGCCRSGAQRCAPGSARGATHYP
jgi:hypothetical protein